MDYKSFLIAIRDGVKKYTGEEAEVLIHRVMKNNGVVLDGLVILEKEKRCSPTIYLNDFYGDYLNGYGIDNIIAKVYGLYLKNVNGIQLPEDFFMDFNKLKHRIAYKLINYERNMERLKSMPYRIWQDLAIVYFVVCDESEEGRAIVMLHNNHIKMWNVTEEELYQLARKNTPEMYNSDLRTMDEVISELLVQRLERGELLDGLIDFIKTDGYPVYVLTNNYKNSGAICILYEGVLEAFGERIKKDFYILPSSIHEVILVPDDGISRDALKDMVRQVNIHEVAKEDLLSDNVYKYVRGVGFEES